MSPVWFFLSFLNFILMPRRLKFVWWCHRQIEGHLPQPHKFFSLIFVVDLFVSHFRCVRCVCRNGLGTGWLAGWIWLEVVQYLLLLPVVASPTLSLISSLQGCKKHSSSNSETGPFSHGNFIFLAAVADSRPALLISRPSSGSWPRYTQ